jgi:hypothetical protein
MFRVAAVLIGLVAAATPGDACTFCGGDLRSRQTLRLHYTTAKAVYYGQLHNPQVDPKTDAGTTEFHITAAFKDDPSRNGKRVLIIPQYLPVIGNTPRDFVLFCSVVDGKLDPTFGLPATAALLDYLKGVAHLADSDLPARLNFYFNYLHSADATIAADAFFEFARAADTDILKAAKTFDPAKVRKLLTDPNIPAERLGVFAFLLGSCGGPADANFLAGLLKQDPLPERTASAFGGLLAGYVLLNPQEGWAFTVRILEDAQRPYSIRLSAIGTVRFFQSTRGNDYRAEVLKCCAALLPQGDLADQAIEDLRRWGYWDLTTQVLAQFDKPTHAAPIVRRCIVRYALCCPREEAKQFVTALRQSDPKLVRTVEEMLELYAPTPKK